MLPRALRPDIYRLYNVLRTLDDAVDDDRPQAERQVAAVERWTQGERPSTAETVALADIEYRYGLSRQPLADFCAAMRHDMARAPIENEDDLERYCECAGGSVGVILAQIIGSSRPDAEAHMATLGKAVQRTNILRDIDDDFARDRVYIARTTIERYGPPLPGEREELLRDQIARADALYEQALSAMPILSRWQRGLALSATLYREVLRQIEREGYGRRRGGVVVPGWRRRALIARFRLIPL
jgi:phytoene synthase